MHWSVEHVLSFFYHIRVKISECWLAETEGILATKKAWLRDAGDWLSARRLQWVAFPLETDFVNAVQKRNAFEFDQNAITLWTKSERKSAWKSKRVNYQKLSFRAGN